MTPHSFPTFLEKPRAGPSWRVTGILAALVLAAHVWVLQTSPARFGPQLETTPVRALPFVTRRIEAAAPEPAPLALPPLPLQEKPKAKAKSSPPLNFKKKEVETQVPLAQPAIESIAESSPALAPEPVLEIQPHAASASTADATATAPIPAASTPPPASPTSPAYTAVTAMTLPASARLVYKTTGNAKGMTYHAKSELSWKNLGSTYEASMSVSALFLGSRSMASTGQLDGQGLAPTRFSDTSRSEVAAHFEPEKNQITFSANTPPALWIKGGQDRVSVFLQLGGMLAGNPAGFPVGATITLYTIGPREADTWTFLVEAEEQIKLPWGDLATLKLTRRPRREYDQKVEIWYTPSLGYLPVRNKITQFNGDFVDQQLSELEQ